MPPTMELTTTLLQVIRGGDPDEDELGFRLSGTKNPRAISYFGTSCACDRTALFERLWECLRHHDLFSEGTDLWLRTVDPEDVPPLPVGATVIDEHLVAFGVA